MACLLRRLSHLPIYWVTDHGVRSPIKRYFLRKMIILKLIRIPALAQMQERHFTRLITMGLEMVISK